MHVCVWCRDERWPKFFARLLTDVRSVRRSSHHVRRTQTIHRDPRATDRVQALAVPVCAPAVLRLLAEFGEAAPDVHIWHHAELARAVCTTVVSLVSALDTRADGPTAAIGAALRATMAGLFRDAQTPSKTGAWQAVFRVPRRTDA